MFSAWHKRPLTPRQLIAVSALVPMFIVFCYYVFSGVYPFGPHTIMTVDLGQQYVDFYEYFRNIVHGQWDQAFYSFQKGYGGEMLGTWSYYLLSPTLFLLALFPKQWLSVGIWLMVLIKIGVAGASFQYLLHKRYHDDTLGSFLFSISYALMGYFSANQLNVMWLDTVAVLPLVIAGVEQLFSNPLGGWRELLLYIFALAFAIGTNYYMGYMICLFLVFYFPFAFVEHWRTFRQEKRWQWPMIRNVLLKFIVGSLLAAGLVAVILLPTLYSLGLSKSSYTHFTWDASFNFSPLDFISKLIIGAFNFDQMPKGYPNVFVGSLTVVSFLVYFMDKKQQRMERIVTAVICGLLFFTMTQSSLNIIWHGFQSPIWYPYRYSYVVSFWMLYVGYRSFRHLPSLKQWQALSLIGIGVVSFGLLYWQRDHYSYLTVWQLLISGMLYLGVIGLLYLKHVPSYRGWSHALLTCLVLSELGINHLWTLNSLSYLDQKSFTSFISETTPLINQWKPDSNTFYRMTKTFQRTKNDAFQLNYYDLNHFNSTLERNASVFFDRLGQPTSDGFINYMNGTLVTDAFFGVRYFLSSNQKNAAIHQSDAMTRADLASYNVAMNDGEHYKVYENPNSVGLGFVVPEAIQNLHTSTLTPIEIQEQWLELWQKQLDKGTENPSSDTTSDNQTDDKTSDTDSTDKQTFFNVENYQNVQLINADAATPNRVNTFYEKKDKSQEAFINVKIKIPTDDPYYLTIPGNLDTDDVEFYLNGEKMAYDASFRHTQVYNIADKQAGETVTFSLKLKANHLTLDYLNIYSLNQSAFDNVMQVVKAQPFQVTDFHNQSFKGTVDATEDLQMLALSIPYNEGWQATVNGDKTETISLFDGGMTGIRLPHAGHYTIRMTYHPPYLLAGGAISVVSATITLLIAFKSPKRKKGKEQLTHDSPEALL
ncbi:MAG: YfhO family protein [Aerococcus sp.]|nr:YfhO family protein [Aerococcus sp.]